MSDCSQVAKSTCYGYGAEGQASARYDSTFECAQLSVGRRLFAIELDVLHVLAVVQVGTKVLEPDDAYTPGTDLSSTTAGSEAFLHLHISIHLYIYVFIYLCIDIFIYLYISIFGTPPKIHPVFPVFPSGDVLLVCC